MAMLQSAGKAIVSHLHYIAAFMLLLVLSFSGQFAFGAAATVDVEAKDYVFEAKVVTIHAGDTVRWTNHGQALHTITASDQSWTSPNLAGDQQFARVFTVPGTYTYYCKFHGTAAGGNMAGTVIVQGQAPAPTPVPSPAPSKPTKLFLPVVMRPVPVQQKSVDAIDFAYTPKTLVLKVGETVQWTNKGAYPHTVSASDNSWDSGILDLSRTFTKTFDKPGTYAYFCKYHGGASGTGMAGTIIVQAEDAPPIPTPGSPPAPTAAPPSPTSAPAPAPGTSDVSVIDFSYTPKTLTVSAGSSVRFTNTGGAAHTATGSNSSWDSGKLNSGASFTHTFAAAGTYTYYCQFHGSANGTGMAGTIIVQGAGSPGAPPPPSVTPAPVGQPIKATLAGGPNWPAATGFARYENKGTSQQFYLELKGGRSYQATGVDIFIDGRKVAVAQMNNAGECKLELRTDNGQVVPAINIGTEIVMKLPGGELLASGTF